MPVNVSLFQMIEHLFCFIVIINVLLNLCFKTLISGHVIKSTFAYFKFKNAELSKTTAYLVSFFKSCNTLPNCYTSFIVILIMVIYSSLFSALK